MYKNRTMRYAVKLHIACCFLLRDAKRQLNLVVCPNVGIISLFLACHSLFSSFSLSSELTLHAQYFSFLLFLVARRTSALWSGAGRVNREAKISVNSL